MFVLPLLIVLLLISTPGLYWAFNRFQVRALRVEFWVLITSGLAWVLSLVLFMLKPDLQLNPIWNAGFSLLPNIAFKLDVISSAFILGLTTLIFFGELTNEYNPQTSSWLTPLSGVVLLILVADTAYTVALGWTVLEALYLYRFLRNQGEMQSSTRYILAVLLRLSAPLLLIYVSMIYSTIGQAPKISELDPRAASLVLTAGVVGFLGWFQTIRHSRETSLKITSAQIGNWLPAAFGLILITRATGLSVPITIVSWSTDLAVGLISLVLITGAMFLQSERILGLGSLGLMICAFLLQSQAAALIFSILFLLPGMALLWRTETKRAAFLKLVLITIGFLPLPFFPAWVGLIQLSGLSGYFLTTIYGLLFSRLVYDAYLKWDAAISSPSSLTPLEITGAGTIIISQYLVSFSLGLFGPGLRFDLIPISAWMAPIFMVIGTLIWSRLPIQGEETESDFMDGSIANLFKAGEWIAASIGEIVYLMTRLFEGDGGLMWTLLLGFLVFTLARFGGG